MKRELGNRLSFIMQGGENMSEQNEFGRVSAEELERYLRQKNRRNRSNEYL